MDFNNVVTFLTNYSVPTIIISILITVLTFIFDRFILNKLPFIIKGYVPFILGIILFFLYDTLFISHKINLSEDLISGGILCGSLSTAFFTFINRVFINKKTAYNFDAFSLSIEGIIKDYVDLDDLDLTVLEIKNSVVNDYILGLKEETVFFNIKSVLTKYCKKPLNDIEKATLSYLIISSYKSLKNL